MPTDSHPSERVQLVRWGLRFFLATTLLLQALGIRYLAEYTWPAERLAIVYAVAAFVGQFALLGMLPWVAAVLPLTLAFPSRRAVQWTSVILAAALFAVIQTDSLVFAESRFHLSALALRVLGFQTWAFAVSALVISLALCTFLARLLARQLTRGNAVRWPRAVIIAFAACFLFSQTVYVWADAHYHVAITGLTPYLPLYKPITAKHLLARWLGAVDLERTREASKLSKLGDVQDAILDYPKKPLQCAPPPRPLNVLIIGIDAMRADSASPRVAPHIAAFGEQALRFTAHWSAGNGTRPGLFSLFYGLPATYWSAFYAAQQPPVLIETFQEHGYRVGVFPSNPTDKLVGLDRTAFRSVADLPDTSGDLEVTSGWLDFVAHDTGQPFFGFLFYESSPGSCPAEYPRPPDDVAAPGNAGPRRCYETAVHFADAQIARVLDDLEQRGLFDSTVVLITSDHGEEFDENGLGFHGHGSSFSSYQLRTPMLVRWPGRGAERIARRTSHHDVAPTLLGEILACSNDPSDYSSGHSMFTGEQWDWYVASSYTGLAVIEPDRVTISYGPYFEVRGPDYRLLDSPDIRSDVIAAAIRETGRFYRR
jgi:uncharacterized protein